MQSENEVSDGDRAETLKLSEHIIGTYYGEILTTRRDLKDNVSQAHTL